MRIDKFLSGQGMGSRKEIKELAKKGRIRLNGIIVKGTDEKMDPDSDRITVDDREVIYSRYQYYMLNKPQGVVSATADEKDMTVIDLLCRESATRNGISKADSLNKQMRGFFPVGRLDKDTEGLLVITNDGEMAHRLLSPSKHIRKVYRAGVEGLVGDEDIVHFSKGICLKDGTVTKPAILTIRHLCEETNTSEVDVTIFEGKYHQIKRMFAACGKHVVTLKRLAMGNLWLDETLQPGQYRLLTNEELHKLTEKEG